MLYNLKANHVCYTNLSTKINVQIRMCDFYLNKSFISLVDHMDLTTYISLSMRQQGNFITFLP